ncbi:MAG: hypothetical protein RSE57_04310 [Clostridia bacterium]
MDKTIKKELYEIFLVGAVVAVLLICNVITKETFEFLSYEVQYTMIIYPLTFALVGLILRKFSQRDAIVAVVVAGVVQILVFYLFKYMNFEVFASEKAIFFSLAGFIVSQLLNIGIINKKADTHASKLIRYAIISLVDNVIFISVFSIFTNNFALAIIPALIATIFKYVFGMIYEFIIVSLDGSMRNQEIKSNNSK